MDEISTSHGSAVMWCYNERRTKHERHDEDSVPLAIVDDVLEGIPDLVESHLTLAIECYLEGLPRYYYTEVGENRLQAGLLGLVCNYYESTCGKSDQLRHALRLLLLVLMMGQTMYLTEDSRRELEPELQSWLNPSQCQYPMPRIAQRQFKFMVHQMVHEAMRDVLEDLHNLIWKKKKNEWATTFCVMVLLGIIAEDLQISLMLVAISLQVNEDLNRASDFEQARNSIRAIDESGFGLPLSLFEKAYGSFNPLTGPFNKVEEKLGDEDSIELVRGVRELVKRESQLLVKAKGTKVLPAPDSFSVDNISRLVSRILPDPQQ
ncbi:hypothetical protein FGG08_003893 [Glutinoglossum americanum]|uniref:Uncharacterized protein n=1 Tax=Glutinoglossum americanum TaxID=1670608 RepID=A0A9P8I6T2_9PEZI|nr:hypothetical protein FGG08_003893 [Glutinoglossum americanum]